MNNVIRIGIKEKTQNAKFYPTYNEKDFIKEVRLKGNNIRTEGALLIFRCDIISIIYLSITAMFHS